MACRARVSGAGPRELRGAGPPHPRFFHNLILTVVPERILVGGGVVLGQPTLLPRIRRALQASLGDYGHVPRSALNEDYLCAPALGERAGPLGAIAVAHRALQS